MTERPVVLQINNITKMFGGLCAVDNFCGDLSKNQIKGIIGPNGAGKTTILNLISGIYPPTKGEIFFHDEEISKMKTHKITQMGISRTFQNIRLFDNLTVMETVKSSYSWRAPYSAIEALVFSPRVSRFDKEIEEKSLHYLEMVDLIDYTNVVAKSLPYGLQRRVEIARALASEPEILLLDEPGAGLNHTELHDLVDLITMLFEQLSLSIMLIDHRMDVIMKLCDWIYVQDFGKSIAQGTPEEIQKDPTVIQAYLGSEIDHA